MGGLGSNLGSPLAWGGVLLLLPVIPFLPPPGDNATYKVPGTFPMPPCSPLHQEPMAPQEFAYDMGPSLECLNDTCLLGVLPGHSYRCGGHSCEGVGSYIGGGQGNFYRRELN